MAKNVYVKNKQEARIFVIKLIKNILKENSTHNKININIKVIDNG